MSGTVTYQNKDRTFSVNYQHESIQKACGTPDASETSESMHDYGFPSLSIVDQQMQAPSDTKEENRSIEELDMVNKPTEHPMNLIIMPVSEKTTGASENK